MVERLCHGISGVTGVVGSQGSANRGTGGVASSCQCNGGTPAALATMSTASMTATMKPWQQNWNSLIAAVVAMTGATVEGQQGQWLKSYSTSDNDEQHQ